MWEWEWEWGVVCGNGGNWNGKYCAGMVGIGMVWMGIESSVIMVSYVGMSGMGIGNSV